jgi:DUF4097 and DUF4098 domain-containing protein YvlB
VSNGGHHRSSLFAALLLILLGVIFFLDRVDPLLGLGHLIRLYWPILIIVWGVAKLVDHLSDRKAGQPRSTILSGGEAALLVLLALVLGAFVFRDWIRDHYADIDLEIPPFSQRYSESVALAPQTLPPVARVEVTTKRGNVTVHASEGNALIVSATKSAPGPNESTVQAHLKDVGVQVESRGNGVRIHPANLESAGGWASVDLDVEVPKATTLAINASHGDIRVSGVAGNIDAHADSGDVEIHDAGGDISAEMQKGDARITNIRGNLRVNGRGDDIEIADVSGDVTIDGAFLGSTRVRNVGKTTHCTSPWYDVTILRMTGRMELDSSDIAISDAAGDARIVTHNKDIDVENVGGRLEITDSHGDVKVGYANPPGAGINITNDSGDVNLTLPAKSSFELSAASRSGEVESDFEGPSLRPVDDEDNGRLSGKFGGSGPPITINTTYGTIHLGKLH